MAGTNISVTLDFRADNTIKHISWTMMQRYPRKSGEDVYGNAQLEVHSPEITIEWLRDADLSAGMEKLAIRQIILLIEAKTTIRMFDGIDKTSKGYKHVADHERKHVKLYKRALTRSVRQIRRALNREKFPTLKKPIELAPRDAEAFVRRWNMILRTIQQDELKRATDGALAFSEKIHTSMESKRTGKLCAQYKP